MTINPKRTFRYYLLRFKRLGGDPHSLALGTAIGIFIGLTPTLPFHTIAIICFTLLIRANTISGLISAAIVSNPFTFVPQYYIAWKIGNMIMPGRLTWERIKEALEILTHESFSTSLKTLGTFGFDAFLVMIVGGIILALPPAIACYYASLRFFIKIREKRQKKHLLNK